VKKLLPTLLSIAVICGLSIGLLGAVGCGGNKSNAKETTKETTKESTKEKKD
jgi:hypothetical protein